LYFRHDWADFIQNPFRIFVCNHNSEGWIQAYGFALFIFPKLHSSGFRFDSGRKNEIGCMYQFDICNNSKNFENFDYLNKSRIDVRLGYEKNINFLFLIVSVG